MIIVVLLALILAAILVPTFTRGLFKFIAIAILVLIIIGLFLPPVNRSDVQNVGAGAVCEWQNGQTFCHDVMP